MTQEFWTTKEYFILEDAVKAPLKEQWIFFYSGKKEDPLNDESKNSPEKQQEENSFLAK